MANEYSGGKMQWRFWDFARNGFWDFARNDSTTADGRSAFQAMVERRLAQLSDGGVVWNGHRENGGDEPGAEHGGAASLDARSPDMAADLHQVHDISYRYDQDKWNARFDADAQARWHDEELSLLNQYQRKHAVPQDKGGTETANEDLPGAARPDPAGNASATGKTGAPAEIVSLLSADLDPAPAAVPDIDLPEGFDNVGAFELN